VESKKKKTPTSTIEQTGVGGMAKMCLKKKKSKEQASSYKTVTRYNVQHDDHI